MSQPRRILALLGLIGLLGVATLARLQLTYDLAFFLPPANTAAQQLLLERVGQGPGAQLTFILLPTSANAELNPQEQAQALAERIRQIDQVQRVLPEPAAPNIQQIPGLLWEHRLLLQDLPNSQAAWLDALNRTLDDLMFASDPDERALLAADPTLASLTAIEQFSRLASNQSFSTDRGQVLLVQASAAAFDLDAQTTLVDQLRGLLQEQGLSSAQLYGSGVYGVDLQRSVQREATLYSMLASIALLALLFFYLRSPRLVLVTGLPLLLGGVAGLAALAYLFHQVHGITLAFGFTLLGVAVDYPLHLVVHQQRLGAKANSLWPTLRLGVLSTAIAYLAFAMGGTQGLQQLGLFALVGITTAALASAWLCPTPNPGPTATSQSNRSAAEQPAKLRHWPWALVLAITTPLLATTTLFSDDLGALTPVPAETLAADGKLRRNLGVSDMRYLIALRGADQEELLQQTEQMVRSLQPAVQSKQLQAYQSITSLLPSQQTQQARRAAMVGSGTLQAFDAALLELPFAPEAFASFRETLAQYQQLDGGDGGGLDWTSLQLEPQLGSAAQNLMYPSDSGWVSLIFLAGIQEPERLEAQVAKLGIGQWVDLKAASLTLAADYRERVLRLLAIALGGILLLLLTLTRQPQRVLWLFGSLAATITSAMLGSLWLQGLLSLFDLMALTLVAGLGLDYALFYSKNHQRGNEADLEKAQGATARAVLLCALSSLLVFGILACSSVPLLQGIGTTVACGVVAAYLLARFGRYQA